MSRPLKFAFPPWLWAVFGLAIVAIALPLAFQQAMHGELLHACTPGNRSTVPLAARNWRVHSGALVYVSVGGWLAVAASGLLLSWKRGLRWAPAMGIAGFAAVVFALWRACA